MIIREHDNMYFTCIGHIGVISMGCHLYIQKKYNNFSIYKISMYNGKITKYELLDKDDIEYIDDISSVNQAKGYTYDHEHFNKKDTNCSAWLYCVGTPNKNDLLKLKMMVK